MFSKLFNKVGEITALNDHLAIQLNSQLHVQTFKVSLQY